MKKYFIPISTSLFLGIIMAYFIIKQYDSLGNIAVSGSVSKIYYIQNGIYSDKENMENNMKDFQEYIYIVENNLYYTYIGISHSKENALKLQNYYNSLGYNTSVKEKLISNKEFVQILKQYDKVLEKTEDGKAIETICKQVLDQLEEYENGKYKD